MLNGTLLWYSEPIFDAKMRTPELACSDALKRPQILACSCGYFSEILFTVSLFFVLTKSA